MSTSCLTVSAAALKPNRLSRQTVGQLSPPNFPDIISPTGLSADYKTLVVYAGNIQQRYLEPLSFVLPLEFMFRALSEKWKRDTQFHSSVEIITSHPSYRAIISLGIDVVPLIIEDLAQEPLLWFDALTAITGEQPIPESHAGDVEAMARDWIVWGIDNGYFHSGRGRLPGS